MPPGDLVLFKNIGLTDADTGGHTATIGEPTVANNGREILYTGNWYATRSLDDGASWDFLSPFNYLPPASGGFCCDQVALYDHSRDLTFWLLQYIVDGNTNTLRLAVKRGATLGNNSWYWWDLRPADVDGAWTDVWFDYPDLALSNDYLYLTANVFTSPQEVWERSVVFKFPLDDLASATQMTYRVWNTTAFGNLRCVQGARDTMYFAAHTGLDQIRVWTWGEESNQLAISDVDVTAWTEGTYTAAGPDGNNWLGRADGRITGAWAGGGVLGFMWTANASGSRAVPHVRVVRINEETKALIDEPDIWSSSTAYAYPAACPNDLGHVGITMFRSDAGAVHPSHVVGVLDDYSPSWSLLATRDGTHGPADGKWGDYLACRRHSPDGLTWMATGFTLRGGSNRINIEPRLVHFGRRRYTRAVARWQGL